MKAWTQLLEPGPALATICLVLAVSAQAFAAPTLPEEQAEQSTEIEYYPVADATGCYYNFQHYDEGDRIITNEPCLNCTCHNRMLMCYLKVCPFTKAIGANCKVEKRPDQCCPVITCPEVPVQLVTSTAPSTALGHLNEYGCSIDNLFYSDGARVPSDPENPCELCYCIRNKTACVMQECTLNVDGCTPVFQEGVCCPVRYNCEHPDYLEGPTTPQISTTTTTTTVAPTTTLQSVECFFNGRSYNDGELVKKDIPCEKCYCLKGDILCAVQECGPTPLDKANCTALPIREGSCCPETYDCAGVIEEELTTLSSTSYEPEPTTQPIVDLGITQGPLTTAPQVKDEKLEERKKLEGLTEGTELPEVSTTAAIMATSDKVATEGQQPEEGQHVVEEGGDTTEEITQIPEVLEEITRQSVEAPKPAEHATDEPSEQTSKPALEDTSEDIQEVTEVTEKLETEHVTRVGVETETTEKELVTFVPAISSEETTKADEASEKPSAAEETVKPSFEEQTAKPTESPIESVTSRVTEAIESVTSRLTEAVEAITKAIIGSSSEVPSTEVPAVTEVSDQLKEGGEPEKEGITEQPREGEKETKVPEEEAVTRVIAVTEEEPSFPTHPSVTDQPEVEPDKVGVTPAGSEKEKPEKEVKHSDQEKPSGTESSVLEKEQPETTGATEEIIKGPTTESILPTEQQPTTLPAEKKQPEHEQVVHDEHKTMDEEQETEVPIIGTEMPKEGATTEKPQEEVTEVQPSGTERTDGYEASEQTEPSKKAPESQTESIVAIVTEEEPASQAPDKHVKITEGEISTEPSVDKQTEPTVETKPGKDQSPATEEPIVPSDCTEQGCVKVSSEKPYKTEHPIEEGTSQAPEGTTQPEREEQASESPEAATKQPASEQTTPFSEQKPETDKTVPLETKTEKLEEVTAQSSTEKEEVVIVTEIPTKKTELPESMDHVSETVYPTERPEEGKPSTESKTEKIDLEPSTTGPEISKELEQKPTEQGLEISEKEKTERPEVQSTTEKAQPEHYYPTETPSKEHTKQPSQEITATEDSGEGTPREPTGATETIEPPTEEKSEQPLEESKTTEVPLKAASPATEVSKEEESKEPPESTKTPSAEIPQPTTELPKEEDNEIEHEESVDTRPKTEEKRPEGDEIKVPGVQTTTEVSMEGDGEKEVTTQKELETEEQITEKPIIPEVCTSESECVPGVVPLLPEVETESTKIPEEASSSPKPEEDTSKAEGTTESNKIPESEEHTEETNEIPEGGTEEVPKVTGEPDFVPSHAEESSGEKPVSPKDEEGSGQEPEEGSGFTSAAPEEVEVTETIPKVKVTKRPDEQPESTTVPQEKEQGSHEIPHFEEPATLRPQEISTEEAQLIEQSKTEQIPEAKPTEYPEPTTYTEGTQLPEREIPGEGNCLVDGQTYKNNSSVPPINHCQTSCKCVSSILRCESIECTPSPAGMQNCMPIFISPDSCCPTYSCTGPETTSPMESDSHVIQTTTPLSKEPATLKDDQVEETERPVIVTTEQGEPEILEKATELEKSVVTEEAATEEVSIATELTVPDKEFTEQEHITEKPVIIKHCDESSCTPPSIEVEEKPSKQPEEEPIEGTKSTERPIAATSPEYETPQGTLEPESETEISTETRPEEEISSSKPEEVQPEQTSEKDHATTIESVIRIKPEEETSAPESSSKPYDDSKPSNKITSQPEEVTQVSQEEESTVTETEKSKETGTTEEITEKQKQESIKPIGEELSTETAPAPIVTDTIKSDEASKISTTEISIELEQPESSESYPGKPEIIVTDTIKPDEATKISTTEISVELEQPESSESYPDKPEIIVTDTFKPDKAVKISTTEVSVEQPESSESYPGKPEVSTETDSGVTEELEVVTKEEMKPELPDEPVVKQPEEEKKPSEIGATEEPSVASTAESKVPEETTASVIKETKKPEIPEIESTTVVQHPEIPSETTILPEKGLTPEHSTESEKITEPASKVEEGRTTEQPTEVESHTGREPIMTQLPDIQERGTTEVTLVGAEQPEGVKPVTTKPADILTEGESPEYTTKVVEKEQVSTETPVTEQEKLDKKSQEKIPPKEEKDAVQYITLPPESESTGKPIESESHVTSPESLETATPKVSIEKSTEKTIEESPISDKKEKTTTVIPLEEISKPETIIPTDSEQPIIDHIATTTESVEHVKVTAQEVTVTDALLVEGSTKPTEEEKVSVEGQKELTVVTEELPVESHTTQQSSISPSEKTPEKPSKETTLPTIEKTGSPQTEKTVETSEEVTEVIPAATERTSADTSVTERTEEESPRTETILEEKETETPLVLGTEKPTASEKPMLTEEPAEEPSKTEKITIESATVKPSDVTEEPSEEDNEIPGVIPEKETEVSEQGHETTEQPKEETEKPAGEETTEEAGLISLPEKEHTKTSGAAEGATTISSVDLPIVQEEEQTSSKEGASSTLQPKEELPITRETERPSITEESKTSAPEESTTEEKLKPHTERPIISEEKKDAISTEPPTGETEMPSVSAEEGKTPTAQQPISGQTEQPSISDEESKTLAPERPITQGTERPFPEEVLTPRPEYPIHGTEIPEEGTTSAGEEKYSSKTEKAGIPEEGITAKPSIPEEEGKTSATEQPTISTEKSSTSEDETKQPIISLEEEALTRKPLEGSPVTTTPDVTTSIAKENISMPLFTSGPKVETTTGRHIPGELSTSAPVSEPTTILPATTSTDSPAHIPGEQVPELPDYEQPGEEYDDDEQNAFGPGTCRYGGKVYVSAQQIPRDDPCDFCFCFRSDIICLQQSCPPPIPRCHEEPIRGFCCPRYECPVSMATAVNVTTSTTTTTTTLPPHFLSHAYKGRASKTGCQISGKAYKVGEAIRATSGPCLHCTCGGDGQMKCDPKPCSPEPMLRQMIAAAASRRRR